MTGVRPGGGCRRTGRAARLRALAFIAPALGMLTVYLLWPVLATAWASISAPGPDGARFVGGRHYARLMADPEFREALANTLVWLALAPVVTTALGLGAAVLSLRLVWGAAFRLAILAPMAVSAVGAAVIWKLVYEVRPEGQPQLGILNALWLEFQGGGVSIGVLQLLPAVVLLGLAARALWAAVRCRRANAARSMVAAVAGLALVTLAVAVLRADLPFGQPLAWLQVPLWNTVFLMVVLVWGHVGLAMVILLAALRAIPRDTLEAARLDGARPWQVFVHIQLPQIRGTLATVWAVQALIALKVFDIVLALTNGQWQSGVLAHHVHGQLFVALDRGVGSAAAMVMVALVVPVIAVQRRVARGLGARL